MIDVSNDGLLNNNNKRNNNMLSFDSISEKQEESSNSSNKNSKILVSKTTGKNNNNRSLLKSNDVSQDGINDCSISIKKAKPKMSKKSIKDALKEDDKEKYKKYMRKEMKKKTSQAFAKRTSFQRNNFDIMHNQLRNYDKRASSKNIVIPINTIKQTVLKDKKNNLNVSTNNVNKTTLSALYNKNSVFGTTSVNNVNLSNSDFLDMKYFAGRKMKNTMLKRDKLNLKEKKDMHFSHLFEKLKDSYLFEKSEAVLLKIKICYGFLAVFSFVSILLEIIDVVIFNKKSKEFMDNNYNIYFNITDINGTNIHNFHLIEKREISSQENTIRIFNSIFSFLCFIFHLIIHNIKNNYDKSEKKKKKKSHYRNYNYNRRKTKFRGKDDNKSSLNENRIKIVKNNDLFSKNYVTREERLLLIINCIISIVFFPPNVNKVFVGIQHRVIYVYSLNSIVLLITFFKISNIYFAFYYLSPFNNLLYNTICSSNMVKMDIKFMFRLFFNLYPIYFIIINFIIITLMLCILLFCIEYFSLSIQDGRWNDKNLNDLNNFYNKIFLFCSFVIKTVHGNIKAESELGTIILILGGTVGLGFISYLIYFLNQIFDFRPEEQQAYTKLVKLLNPLNNEHKASNVIKIFFLIKKMYIDNNNIDNEYKLKKEKNFKLMVQRNFGYKFNFNLNDSSNSLSNYAINSEYKEKKKFLKFIGCQFVLKAKITIECKNFQNNLLIARNNSLSFNDVLKTLGDKMNGNINQLNNKIEVLIQNDEKFRNFMKFQNNSMKKIFKVMIYQKSVLNYLIEINNEISVGYINDNKEFQQRFLNKYKNVPLGGMRRLKSTFNGPFFNFGKKNTSKKMDKEEDKTTKKKQNVKGLFDLGGKNKTEFKRVRSSIVGVNSLFNYKNVDISKSRSKTNPIKIDKNNNGKSKSFDDKMLEVYKNRNSTNKVESNFEIQLKRTRNSLLFKKKMIDDKWKNLFD
jgi:hypothetical protein